MSTVSWVVDCVVGSGCEASEGLVRRLRKSVVVTSVMQVVLRRVKSGFWVWGCGVWGGK